MHLVQEHRKEGLRFGHAHLDELGTCSVLAKAEKKPVLQRSDGLRQLRWRELL